MLWQDRERMPTTDTAQPRNPSEIAYRPHIDGLRAVAVLLVMFNHLGTRYTRGGFVGVDIFFVISGYLITGNIDRMIAAGTFSLMGFYERRIRRIVPALLVMLAVSSVFAYRVLLPAELVEYSRLLLATVFSYSNLHLYWLYSGHFDSSNTRILLHTWSLGVEEQFYLVIPVAMLLAGNRIRLLRGLVLGAGLISLCVAAWCAFREPLIAFYMPYARGWELLAGALISLHIVRCPESRRWREGMVAGGLLVIALYARLYNVHIPFPGLAAAPPCLAAMLLIMAGDDTSMGAWLRWKPLVFLGKVSYSLYLWHLPVIAMVQRGMVRGLTPDRIPGQCFVVIVSILLAYLSWRFVEQPFRTGRFRSLSRRRIFLYAAAGALAMTIVAVALMEGRNHHIS